MAFTKTVILMLAGYAVLCTVMFGPIAADVLSAEQRVGQLPVKPGLSEKQRIAYVREKVRATVTINGHPYGRGGMGRILGTGSLLDEEGYILTAAHVASGNEFVYVQLQQLDTLGVGFDALRAEPADVLAVDVAHDMAIMKLRHPERVRFSTMRVDAGAALTQGTELWFIGVRSVIGKMTVMQTNVALQLISNNAPVGVENMVLAFADVSPGDSGGPVFDKDGNVVGVIVGTDPEGKPVSALSPLRGTFPALMEAARAKAKTLR